MSNQKSGLRFRIPSWFAPSSASSSQPPPQKSSNQSASIPPPTTQSNNTSSATAKQVLPSDEVQSRKKSRTGTPPPASTAAQKTPFKPPGKASKNSNSQSKTSKTKADSLPQARRTSQAIPHKEASPTKLKTQPSTPSPLASQPKATPFPPTPSTPPQRLPMSKVTSPTRSKPKNGPDHELESTDEAVSKSPHPINSPMSVTQMPKSEPIINGGELKPDGEVVSKSSSPKKSPQSSTKETSKLPTTITQLNSATDGKPVAANSSAQENTRSNEIPVPKQPKEQIPSTQGDSQSPIPTPGAISPNVTYQRAEIAESRLAPEVGKKVTEKAEETKDADEVKEKNVLNELQKEGSSGFSNESKEQRRETEKNISESCIISKQYRSPKQPRHDDSNGGSSREHAARRGEEFPHIKVTQGDEVETREERAISVITLAGENRGATMAIGSVRDEAMPIHRGYRVNKDVETKPNKQKPIDDYASEMYMNSNVQSINNSIMFNSSITQRDPGVHVVRSNKTAETNTTESRKLAYEQPNVRRRCLRGLLLESSDSDQDRPRRHGCRV